MAVYCVDARPVLYVRDVSICGGVCFQFSQIYRLSARFPGSGSKPVLDTLKAYKKNI